jgi:hypothetical protein
MKRTLWVLFLLLAVVLAGCGGKEGVSAPASSTLPGGEIFQMALPRLVVDLDAEGNPSILGISPAVLKAFGVDTAGFAVPKATVEQMTKAGIQHLEIASVGDRLMLFANGKPLPHLGWSDATLGRALGLANTLQVQNAALYNRLVPLITRLGLDVVLRFPTQPGAAEVPLTAAGSAKNVTLTPTTDPASAIAKFEIKFDENGVPGIMGLSGNDLAAMGLGTIPGLSPDMISKLQAGNIQNMEVRTKPDGVHIYVNGEPLPTLMWDSALLGNVMDLYSQLSPDSPLLPLIKVILPYLDRADVGILLHFPLAAGAQPIPAKMHD